MPTNTLTLFTLFFLLLLLTLTPPITADHYSAPSSDSLSEWSSARATNYTALDPRDAIAGACGYGDLVKRGFGMETVGLSTTVFEKGHICSACFELRCVEDLRWCIPGTSIIVTATNFCPPNYGFMLDGGGHCNPPNKHFVLPIEAFEKIAIWKVSNMLIQYRRIKCVREGGIRFVIDGLGVFISVLISNVGGAGDVVAVKIKGSRTGWFPMGRNWGQTWHVSADLKKQPLSFEVTTSDQNTLTSYNVAPKDWMYEQSCQKIDYLKDKIQPSFVKERQAMKIEYEEFKVRINALVAKAQKTPEEGWTMQDGTPWPGNNTRDQPGMIQVFLGHSGGLDTDGNELPRLVYVSREKRSGFQHHKKPGAMNPLIRMSVVLTNGAYLLNVDCDHYFNNNKALREAMCFMMDPVYGKKTCYVQFPQRFDGIDLHDRYANRNTVFFDINLKGLDGIQGPVYVGTGCCFNRKALYGYDPLLTEADLEPNIMVKSCCGGRKKARRNKKYIDKNREIKRS